MSQFSRQIKNLPAIARISGDDLPSWWKDLLSLWRPSGAESGEYGLRLAIRNGHFNFYRLGQSIARVEININGEPTAKTNFKYVGDTGVGPLDNDYVKLHGEKILWRRGRQDGERGYGGIEDLKKWIKSVDGELPASGKSGYAGKEKRFVDKLVTKNPDIIDLEMGLPAWGGKKTASRMDIVAIEDRKIVFWEAKLAGDACLRSSTNVVTDEKPEVLKQLANYRKFLAEPEHVLLVAQAYKRAANDLVVLRRAADELGTAYPLGAGIVAAASLPDSAQLEVACIPRLVVLGLNQDSTQPSLDAWAYHAGRLKSENVVMTIIEHQGPFLLGPAA